jgi:hypothetical protein
MERVIALLRERNRCLEEFYWVNEQELINFGGGNFDSVEQFYLVRDKILEAVRKVDLLINQETERSDVQITDQLREEADLLLKSKDELVKSILAQDLQVIEYIEKEKSNIIRELQSNSRAKKAVGAYASAERLKAFEGE